MKTERQEKKDVDDDVIMQKTKTIQKLRKLSKLPKPLPIS
jgi:hypothetical protein